MSGQNEFFAALFDPELPPPAGLSTWNGSDPAARFAVYRNNVVVSLMDALADTYPVTQELVGEEFFRAMARLFVSAQPPRSKVLAFYGETFAAFIEGFPPAASVPYLADMARLEMVRARAYHAADAAEISRDAITQVLADTEGLPSLRIGLHPSATLLGSRYAVASLWAAHQGIAELASVDLDLPESVLVIRPHLDVNVICLQPGTDTFIAQLLQGARFDVATVLATEAEADFDLTATLSMLIHQRAISTLKRKNQP